MKPIRNSKKADYLNQNASSGTKNLKVAGGATKKYEFNDTNEAVFVNAVRVVVPAGEVESKTEKHPLNPRIKEALTLDSVQELYAEILENGVTTEGVAVKDKETGNYLLLDSSRRRFCAIKADKDLPLWVLESVTTAQALFLINSSQSFKKWSWREVGLNYLRAAEVERISKEDTEAIAKLIGVSKETVRKKVQAALVHQELINAFPDSEGIPSTFYAKLSKIEKELSKRSVSVSDFIKNAMKGIKFKPDSDMNFKQVAILTLFETCIAKAPKKKNSPTTDDLAKFTDKNKYARKKVSANGDVSFELRRMTGSVVADIEKYIKSRLSEEE
jgi:ParB family chromosome partitioning protein